LFIDHYADYFLCMNALKNIRTYLLACSLVVALQPLHALVQQPVPTERDGQHDFDFEIGVWKTHISRLQHPLTGSNTWVEYEGSSVVRKVWNGRANVVELEVDGPSGHIEGLSLRLYNPQSHQWSLNFANSNEGSLGQPTVGEFKNGRGEFFDQEAFNGRTILVRNVLSDITPNSYRFEQAFSDDGGKTWEGNWVATDTRVQDESNKSDKSVQSTSKEHEGQNDFDFEIGSWNIHLSRLQDRLAGSTTWVQFDGTSVTRKIWNGRSNLEEFEADSSQGHIEGLTLRLYNPQAHQWSIYWANSKNGTIDQPMIGEFKNGRGEFFDQEPWKGRAVFVRFIWSNTTTKSPHFEQSYSDDGGTTWEVNWITNQTRAQVESGETH
jgi:hypothetical protein